MVGYKRFILIDMDTVENANVGRQILFSIDDIGKFKVECVKQCLLNRWNDISCYTHCNSFETMHSQILHDIDIIIGCVDNLEARFAINAFGLKELKIYIDGGSMGFGGQVQIIIPNVRNVMTIPTRKHLVFNVFHVYFLQIEIKIFLYVL